MIEVEVGHYYMAQLGSIKLRNAPVRIIKNYHNYSLAQTLPHPGALTDAKGFTISVDFSSLLYEMTEAEAFDYIRTYNPSVPTKGDPDYVPDRY